MKKLLTNTLLFFWEITKIVIIALLIVIPIRYFIFQPFFVNGQSMEPNFTDGDYLIIDEISYRFSPPQRGEVIVFRYPNDPSQRYIKRIIGLPGETIVIKDEQVGVINESYSWYLNESDYLGNISQTPGEIMITLGENEYFVMGDNRDASYDSRRWGALEEDKIIGRVVFRAWPVNSLAKIELPDY